MEVNLEGVYEIEAKKAMRFDIKLNQGGRKRKKENSGYGRLMKYLIYKRGMKLQDFCKVIGMSKQAFNYVLNESKQGNFSMKEIRIYAKALRVSEEYFLNVGKKIYNYLLLG